MAARSEFTAYARNKPVSIPVDSVTHLVCDNKYVEVHHPGGVLLVEESLEGIVAELSDRFVRCHRGAAVAKHLAVSFTPGLHSKNRSYVHLAGCETPVKVSAAYRRAIANLCKTNQAKQP